MSGLARKYADEVLLLPREFRAELVCKLFQKIINEAWIKETEQKVKEYDDGKVEVADREEVFSEIIKGISW